MVFALIATFLILAGLSEFDLLPTTGLSVLGLDTYQAKNGQWLQWRCTIDRHGAFVGYSFVSAPTRQPKPVEVLPPLQVHRTRTMSIYSPLRASQGPFAHTNTGRKEHDKEGLHRYWEGRWSRYETVATTGA